MVTTRCRNSPHAHVMCWWGGGELAKKGKGLKRKKGEYRF